MHLAPNNQPVDIEVPLGSVGTQEANGSEAVHNRSGEDGLD